MYAFAVVQRPTNSARPLNCPYEHILQCGTDTDTDTDTETAIAGRHRHEPSWRYRCRPINIWHVQQLKGKNFRWHLA